MTHTQNILDTFAQATLEEIEAGRGWYDDALTQSVAMADKHELPLHIVVGVVAALSPTNQWERNLVDADNMLQTFVSGGYVEDTAPCTYKAMRDKAWSILEDNLKDADAVATRLNGPKITDFFWCIMGDQSQCVIDGHAWCIANADSRTMQEVPSIGKKLRAELKSAYAEAGAEVGFTAYEMQAVTWVAWKRIHNV